MTPLRIAFLAAYAGVAVAGPTGPHETAAPTPAAAPSNAPLPPPPTPRASAAPGLATPPAAPVAATPQPSPDAIAPPDAVEFDVKLTGFRAGFDVTLNGHLIGRMMDSSSEAICTSDVKRGLNRVHVRWFSEGQPSAGSLAIRSRKSPTDAWHYVVKIRKFPFSPADGEGDATFAFDPPKHVPAL